MKEACSLYAQASVGRGGRGGAGRGQGGDREGATYFRHVTTKKVATRTRVVIKQVTKNMVMEAKGLSARGNQDVHVWVGRVALSGALLTAILACRVGKLRSRRAAVASEKQATLTSGRIPPRVRWPGRQVHAPPEGASVHHRPGAQGGHGAQVTGEVPAWQVSQVVLGPPGAVNPGRQVHRGPGAHTPPLPQAGHGTQGPVPLGGPGTQPGRHCWQSGGAPPGAHAQWGVPCTGSHTHPWLPGGAWDPVPTPGQGMHPGPACPGVQVVQVGPVNPGVHTQVPGLG